MRLYVCINFNSTESYESCWKSRCVALISSVLPSTWKIIILYSRRRASHWSLEKLSAREPVLYELANHSRPETLFWEIQDVSGRNRLAIVSTNEKIYSSSSTYFFIAHFFFLFFSTSTLLVHLSINLYVLFPCKLWKECEKKYRLNHDRALGNVWHSCAGKRVKGTVNRDIFTRTIFISLGGVSTGNVVTLDQFLANASANDQTFTTISLCSTFQLFDALQLGNVEPTNW